MSLWGVSQSLCYTCIQLGRYQAVPSANLSLWLEAVVSTSTLETETVILWVIDRLHIYREYPLCGVCYPHDIDTTPPPKTGFLCHQNTQVIWGDRGQVVCCNLSQLRTRQLLAAVEGVFKRSFFWMTVCLSNHGTTAPHRLLLRNSREHHASWTVTLIFKD